MPLISNLAQELRDYIELARPSLNKSNNQSILLNDRGKRPSRVDVWRWLAAWSQKAGFEQPIHPHQFRHGCATALLDSGVDLRSIQMVLGHSSIQTTQIYTNVTSKNLREAIDNHHPLSHLETEK